MEAPRRPPDEADRQAALDRSLLTSTPAEADIDRIARLTREALGAPVTLFTLVDENRQWFKACIGLDETETPRDLSFCGHAILGDSVFVVEDARRDPRFADNPLVTGAPQVIAYAGKPIHDPDGYRLGTLCVIDHEPRSFSLADIARLEDFGRLLEVVLRARKLSESQQHLLADLAKARRDALLCPVARCWNRQGFELLLDREACLLAARRKSLSVLRIDIDRYKALRARCGPAIANQAVASLAGRLRQSLRGEDIIAHFSDGAFAVILPDLGRKALLRVARSVLDAATLPGPPAQADGVGWSISIGGASERASPDKPALDALLTLVEGRLSTAAASGGGRVEIAP